MATEFRSTCGDNYDTNNMGKDFDAINFFGSGNQLAVVSGIGGMTGNCLSLGGGTTPGYLLKNFPNLATRFVGSRVNLHGSLTNNTNMIGFLDTGTVQVGVSAMSDGSVRAFLGGFILGSFTQLCASDPSVVSGGTTFYLGAAVTINNAGEGSVDLYVNNVLVASSGGVTTSETGSNTCNGIGVYGIANGTTYFDDLVINNASGSHNNAVPEPQQVLVAYASGAGRYTQMTPQGAGANWQCVNSVVTNSLATDVAAGTVGLKDAYGMTFPSVSNIVGVSTVDCAKTSDGGSATITPGFSDGTTDALGSAIAVPSSFQFLQECFDINPITTNPWAVADLSTLQKLVERSA